MKNDDNTTIQPHPPSGMLGSGFFRVFRFPQSDELLLMMESSSGRSNFTPSSLLGTVSTVAASASLSSGLFLRLCSRLLFSRSSSEPVDMAVDVDGNSWGSSTLEPSSEGRLLAVSGTIPLLVRDLAGETPTDESTDDAMLLQRTMGANPLRFSLRDAFGSIFNYQLLSSITIFKILYFVDTIPLQISTLDNFS
ncbi:hypothetical protein LSTR_LSTR016733 [Laodelphax striatellus]|uniref:Uncharacterized protein n=1 Tax=Laodelphax striatellus TaxID=195883 RepID=A0A482XIH1_LAOST|nr:hypothetical protein LSTR_LSTR016733 [Laodelphax striatellus]